MQTTENLTPSGLFARGGPQHEQLMSLPLYAFVLLRLNILSYDSFHEDAILKLPQKVRPGFVDNFFFAAKNPYKNTLHEKADESCTTGSSMYVQKIIIVHIQIIYSDIAVNLNPPIFTGIYK